MLQKIESWIDKLLWYLKPRIYECKDIWYIKWMGCEYIVKKWK